MNKLRKKKIKLKHNSDGFLNKMNKVKLRKQ